MAGDWVRVMSRRTGVWHSGIVRRMFPVWGVGFGVEVFNNVKLGGVIASDWHEFANGETVLLHNRASSPPLVREILARAESGMGTSYNLLSQNCEHFASSAFTGKAQSKSLQTASSVAACLVCIGFLGSTLNT